MRKLTTSLLPASILLVGVLTAPPLYAEGGMMQGDRGGMMRNEQCDMMHGRQGGMMGEGGMMQGDRGGMMGGGGMMQDRREGVMRGNGETAVSTAGQRCHLMRLKPREGMQ